LPADDRRCHSSSCSTVGSAGTFRPAM
jgi:hypothetical protein